MIETLVAFLVGITIGLANVEEAPKSEPVPTKASAFVTASVSTVTIYSSNIPFDELNKLTPEQKILLTKTGQLKSGLGSGVIVTKDGNIVTNKHVIGEGKYFKVALFVKDYLKFEDLEDAILIGVANNADLAVLKVNVTDNLTAVKVDRNPVIAEEVIAIGAPLGLAESVSAGIISHLCRKPPGQTECYLQTDAAVNQGNSGGGLFNLDGELVAINTLGLAPKGSQIGLNLSIVSSVAIRIAKSLIGLTVELKGFGPQ